MVSHCAVEGCHNAGDIHKWLSFHLFPFKRPEILQRWISATRRTNWYPSKFSKICGEHFLPSDYQQIYGMKKVLKIDAVPTVFNIPGHLTSEIHIKTEEIEQSTEEESNVQDTSRLNVYVVKEEPDIYQGRPNKFSVILDSNCHPMINSTSTSEEQKSLVDRATQTSENYQSTVNLRRKLKTLQQKVKRKDMKISQMKKVLDEIIKGGGSNEKAEEILRIHFEDSEDEDL